MTGRRRRRRLQAAVEGEGSAQVADPTARVGCFPPFKKWQDFEVWLALSDDSAWLPSSRALNAYYYYYCICRCIVVWLSLCSESVWMFCMQTFAACGRLPLSLRFFVKCSAICNSISMPAADAAANNPALKAVADQSAKRVEASTAALPKPVRTHRWMAAKPQPACDDRCAFGTGIINGYLLTEVWRNPCRCCI